MFYQNHTFQILIITFGDGFHLPVLTQFNVINHFLKMLCKSLWFHSIIHETFNFSYINSFILIMRFKRPVHYGIPGITFTWIPCCCKKSISSPLSQTPKTPRTYFRKKNKKLNNILIEIHEMLKKYEIVLQMNPY